MHIVKKFLHYSSLKILDFLKQYNNYNFIFICMVKEKRVELGIFSKRDCTYVWLILIGQSQ